MWNIIIDITLGISLIFAVIKDYKERRVPNILTYGMVVAGIAMNSMKSGTDGAQDALAGCAIGIGVLIIPFIMGGIGGGDVKLMGGIGALKGPYFIIYTFVFTALIGGISSIIRLSLHRGELTAAWNRLRTSLMSVAGGTKPNNESSPWVIPYAICIAMGVACVFATGLFIKLWKL